VPRDFARLVKWGTYCQASGRKGITLLICDE
jgi:hypothetical protein